MWNCARIVAVILTSGACPLIAAAQTFSVSSPDGDVTATIKDVGGSLFYDLTRNGAIVVSDSRLGVDLQQGSGTEDTGTGIISLSASPTVSFDQTYNTIGLHSTAVNNYDGQTFTISKSGETASTIEFRVFDDGLAFRYSIPGSGNRTVVGESTQWTFPTGVTGWYQSGTNADYANSWNGNASLNTMSGAAHLMGPIVAKYPNGGGYTSITESGAWGYSGLTYVGAGSGTNAIHAAYMQDPSGFQVAAGSYTPWRTVVTTSNLNGLVNSDMINNVAPAANPSLYPNGVNTSWIEPGRSLWSWLDVNNVDINGNPTSGAGINITNMEQYVDKAQELGFEYVTVDSGWKSWSAPGEDAFGVMSDLVAYAHARGIKIIVWKDSNDFYSGDLATGNFSTSSMTSFFDELHSIGVDGIKMDFLRKPNQLVGEDQRVLNFMATSYQTAAGLQMALDIHGAPKDSGQSITFPNALTTEDLRGLESGATASHDATLPFTTLLAGPADYTPGLFSPDRNPGKRGNTSWPHQMAMGVVITSPITHWASGPTTLDNAMPTGSLPEQVFKAIPTTWDETDVLDISQIGTVAAFARRKGDVWFLAMVSGNGSNPTTYDNIDLSFLGSGVYDAIFLNDNSSDQAAFVSSTADSINALFDLDVTMNPGGGFVAMFTPVPEPASVVLLTIGAAVFLIFVRLARASRIRA